MRVVSWFLIGVVGSGLGLVGCGKSESGGDGEAIAREDLAAAYAEVHCANLEPCCQAQSLDFDGGDCREVATAWLDRVLGAYDSFQVAYDAQAAGGCIGALRGYSYCGARAVDAEDVTACREFFVGLVAPGSACRDDLECKHSPSQSADCEGAGNDGKTPGVCEVRERYAAPHGKAGSTCNRTCERGSSCEDDLEEGQTEKQTGCYETDGLYCSYVGHTCEPLVALGEPCAGGSRCVLEAFCDDETELCMPRIADGGTCEDSAQCENDECDYDNNVCVGAGARAVPASYCSSYFGR
jgi:hypothetical protein